MTKAFSAILSAEQVKRAARLRETGCAQAGAKMGWRKIALAMNVSERVLLAHFDPEQLVRKRRANNVSFKRSFAYNLTALNLDMAVGNKLQIPAHVLDERERRLSIVQDPIAEMLGEPPKGYSALDRKRQQASVTA